MQCQSPSAFDDIGAIMVLTVRRVALRDGKRKITAAAEALKTGEWLRAPLNALGLASAS